MGTEMEELVSSCDQAKAYPHSLVHSNTYEYKLTAYYQRLNEREDSLFQNDAEAALDFWEFEAQGHGESANLKPDLTFYLLITVDSFNRSILAFTYRLCGRVEKTHSCLFSSQTGRPTVQICVSVIVLENPTVC